MLFSPLNSKLTQLVRGVDTVADTAAYIPGAFLLLFTFLLLPSIVYGQDQTEINDINTSRAFEIVDTAPVVVNGRVRFHVVGVSAHPAERRARKIAKRIEALAKDPMFDPKTLLEVNNNGAYHQIIARESDQVILTVLEADAISEGVRRTVLAKVLKNSIAESIKEYRHDRQPAVIIKNAIYALASMIVLVALLFTVFWGFRRFIGFLESRVKHHVHNLEARSKNIFQGEKVWDHMHGVLRVLRGVVVVILIYVFANFALNLFPQTRYTAQKLFQFMAGPLSGIIHSVINFIPNLVFLVVLFFITRLVLRLARSVFDSIENNRLQIKGFETDWASPTYKIARVGIIIFSLVIAYPYIPGSESPAFKGISILLGVLFSLGSTSVISNVIAGYAMTYRRAFRVGDRVKIGGTIGDVMERRLLVTHVRTPKNEEVVIPNSTILSGEVTNYSTLARCQGLILHTTVGIGYDVPWRQVEAMLLQAAEHTEGLLKEPKPFIRQKSLADFAVNYELNAYCADASMMMALYTEIHRNIQDVFNEKSVQIMSPAYMGDPAEPKVVPKEQWYTPPAKELGNNTLSVE